MPRCAALASFTSRILLDQIADKWTALILSALCPAPLRFDVRETGVERRLRLPRTLRRLEPNGIVEHRVVQTSPIAVEHAITPLGQSLELFFQALDGMDQGTARPGCTRSV
jgi:DNA-binding HxlR family transcriptional regulator